MSPLLPVFVLGAALWGWSAPEVQLAAVGLAGIGLALPKGLDRRGILGALAAGLGLVALTQATTLWGWLLAFELMSVGLLRAGLTGERSGDLKVIDYYSSICFLTSFALHEMLISTPIVAAIFALGLGLRLGLSMASPPPSSARGLTPVLGLVAVLAAQRPLGLDAESLAPWVTLTLLSPVLAAALGLRIGPAIGLAQLGIGLAAATTLPDPAWRLPWALAVMATGPLFASRGALGTFGRAWAAGASPILLIHLALGRALSPLGLGALTGLLLLPSLVALSAPPEDDEPTSPALGLAWAAAALVAAWSLV